MFTRPVVVTARIVGHAHGVSDDHDEAPSVVDGIFEISTIINWHGRPETVAFKVSGEGPSQIWEPHRVETVTITP